MGVSKFIKTNLPAILTGVSVVSTVGAVYFTYKKAPVISAVISDKSLTKGQKFLGVCKAGAIPIALTVISGGCGVGAQVINAHRLAVSAEQLTAATATAAIATKELKELSEKTKEVVGEEKFEEIKKDIVEDHIKQGTGEVVEPVRVTNVEHISTPGGGNTLWYDDRHDRWFRTSPANVNAAIKKFNDSLNSYDFSSLSELYCNLGLTAPPSDEHIGYTSYANREGINLASFDPTEYPETGEIARIFAIEQVPEIDPDWHCGQLL